MSRSSYSYDCEYLDLYRANVVRALTGKRGQVFLQELAAVLDAMPEKRLIADALIDDEGVCAIGAVCKARGLDVSQIDDEDSAVVGRLVNIADCMAAEIAFINDEERGFITPEQRWDHVRKWVKSYILDTETAL